MKFAQEIARLYALVDLLAASVENLHRVHAAVVAENAGLRAQLALRVPAAVAATPVIVQEPAAVAPPPRKPAPRYALRQPVAAAPAVAPRPKPRPRAPLSPTQAAVRERIRSLDLDTFSRGIYKLSTGGGAHL